MYPIEKYNYVTYDQKNEDGSISKVTLAISTYRGKVVKGVAKCIASDDFDTQKGIELAAARCDLKVCLKRKNRAMKKMHEVAKQIEKLTHEYNKLHKFADDTIAECWEASKRLSDIEEILA